MQQKSVRNLSLVEDSVILQFPGVEMGFLASGTGFQLCFGRANSCAGEFPMLQSLPVPSRF